MNYLGDFSTGSTVYFVWNTNAVAGESITRGTNGTIRVYKNGSTSYSTSGITDTEDFAALTGVHHVAVDTSADGTFYASGSEFMVVLGGATIDSKSINAGLAQFSLRNRSALMPTVAGRTLDVSTGGEAGIDWANVGSSTSAVTLSATTISTSQNLAVALTSTERSTLIETHLTYDIDFAESSTNKSQARAAAFLLNKKALTSTTMTVFKTNGSDTYYTATVVESTSLNPVTSVTEIA